VQNDQVLMEFNEQILIFQ